MLRKYEAKLDIWDMHDPSRCHVLDDYRGSLYTGCCCRDDLWRRRRCFADWRVFWRMVPHVIQRLIASQMHAPLPSQPPLWIPQFEPTHTPCHPGVSAQRPRRSEEGHHASVVTLHRVRPPQGYTQTQLYMHTIHVDASHKLSTSTAC